MTIKPIALLAQKWETWMIALEDARIARQKAAIARVFNNRYTYNVRFVEDQEDLPGYNNFGMKTKGGYAWMCPSCNRVHLANAISAFSGLQYPACCKHGEGHRLHEGIFVNYKHSRRLLREFRLKGWRVPAL
jgi:hypothetical protein